MPSRMQGRISSILKMAYLKDIGSAWVLEYLDVRSNPGLLEQNVRGTKKASKEKALLARNNLYSCTLNLCSLSDGLFPWTQEMSVSLVTMKRRILWLICCVHSSLLQVLRGQGIYRRHPIPLDPPKYQTTQVIAYQAMSSNGSRLQRGALTFHMEAI